MIDPEVALHRALGRAFEDIGVADFSDSEIDDFITALKTYGYIVIREANGVMPGKLPSNEEE
jgi:hypothetical protein